ncbi:SCAN domain-containing protein 3 [Thelohanellus kitauei]|uniref:SCAN domain-containing protein 3 n=1 Tax=Thelohanellus kitauei TaxID=669202 RepID=A0A0C2JKH5_THEKT|nr:SCAN domain-containing protein 3 [Thelohanellus kitauei]
MSEDVLCQLIARLQHSKFAIQLDESIDTANDSQLFVYVRYIWKGHLQRLLGYFNHYFGHEDVSEFDCIRNPFECELIHLTSREQKQLTELSSDRTLRLQFNRLPLMSLWLECFQEYSLLSDKAINVLLPFSTTYLGETGFSAVTAIKTKYRSRLDIEHYIRICLPHIPPRLDKLCCAKQAQSSH